MDSLDYYERRRENKTITFDDRRAKKRRTSSIESIVQRRRLSTQIRQDAREYLKIPVCLKNKEREVIGYTHNISKKGLCVHSDEITLSEDTPLTLQFSFGEVCDLNIIGKVVSCSGKSIGITFCEIKGWEQKILSFVVREFKQSSTTQDGSILNISVIQNISEVVIPKPMSGRDVDFVRRCTNIHASKIVGWGSYLPPNEITSKEISARVKADGYKNVGAVVEALTGIKTRRYENAKLYPSDLAAMAANDALKQANMHAEDLETIIFFGISKDFDEPATANVVQEKIGARNAAVFDLANACNGFVTAVDMLDSLIASRRCENGIVVTGELISPYIDWEPKTKKDFKLSLFGYTIGDAGGAAILTRTEPRDERGIRARWFSSQGDLWQLALAGTLEGANSNNKFFRSEGLELEKASIQYMPRGFNKLMEMLSWTMSDVDFVIPHQIPISILENLYHKTLGIPYEKLIWTFPRYGNLATASMPVAVCEAMKSQRAKPKDKILLLGGAAGFSVGMIGMVL